MSQQLAKQQQAFLACIQHQLPEGASSFHKQVKEQGNIDVTTRVGIYQNAYQVRLQETIDTDHNILGQYLGEEMYELMMNQYITHHPSQRYSLRHFSDQLPNFLAKNMPFCEHPQVSELARFEQRLLNAFDAPDCERANIDALKSLPSHHWPQLKLRFHPSVQLLENQWNVIEIYKALKENQAPPDPINEKNFWLLWRNTQMLTEFRPVDNTAFTMLKLFQGGADFSEVCQTLLEYLPEQDVSNLALQVLMRWLNSGVVARLVYGL